jgi:hypothetical protein
MAIERSFYNLASWLWGRIRWPRAEYRTGIQDRSPVGNLANEYPGSHRWIVADEILCVG